MKPKLLIEVRGGLVQCVTATADMDVITLDWDNISAGEELAEALEPGEPDEVLSPQQFGLLLHKYKQGCPNCGHEWPARKGPPCPNCLY